MSDTGARIGLFARSRAVTLVLLTALVAEVAIGSSGRWLVVGPLSIRMLLLGACLVAGLPLVWRERRYLLREGMVWVTSLFVLTLALSAVWAYSLGNSPAFIVNDLTTFSALLLVPTVVALRLTSSEVLRLTTALFIATSALAVITLAIHVLIPWGLIAPTATEAWLSDRSMGGLADVGAMHRIYLRSQIMFVPALLIGLQHLVHAERHRVWWLVGSSLVATGLVLSLSRSLWIGFFLAFVLALVWCSRDLLALLKASLLAGVGTLVIILGSTAVYGGPALISAAVERLDPSLLVIIPGSGNLDDDDDEADSEDAKKGNQAMVDEEAVDLRGETLALTQDRVRDRPIIGWGIGYNLDSIRDDGRTEYMYWDLLMKLGLLGMVPFLLAYMWVPLRLLRRGKVIDVASNPRILAAGLLGVAVASYFNPFLNSSLGIAMLLLVVAAAGTGNGTPALEASEPGPAEAPFGAGNGSHA